MRVVAFRDIVAIVASDHVHVELRLDLVQVDDREVRIEARAVEAGLFTCVPDEDDKRERFGFGPVANAFAIASSAVLPEPSSSAPLLMMSRWSNGTGFGAGARYRDLRRLLPRQPEAPRRV